MLAFKVAFFILVAAPFISPAPSVSSGKIDCYINYLKSKNFFSEAYSPSSSPISANFADCEQLVHEFHSVSEKTYNDLFARNKETADELDCIMAEFLKTDARDEVMLNVVYENKRLEGEINKDLYCKLSEDAKQKTKDFIIQSVDSCIPNSKFAKTFAFHTECTDPKAETKVAGVKIETSTRSIGLAAAL
ncbi:unnamed protein product [Chironomus riparius]|uniref:Uncharacterized protein n=1 Tax=Chironomus riparius TaxID=315576 RepID=A0A9N9WLE3_9DIPT|nr:unnamed protein product [Chironomus riparius]